ncbi:MAG: hypothetical protein ACMG6S_22115 [Byssovorax sp.]
MASLKRTVLRLDPVCQEQLDEIADLASDVLRRDVSRAAVIRAAVDEWLTKNENVDPAEFIEVIRTGIVKRGRRPWKHLQQRIEVPEEPEQAMAEEGMRHPTRPERR